ncbi:MAG TPA: ABC transporter permease [Opitutaceae bacterium]|nr:ABC transporter permease [Opitutaceae bacterium]
MKLLRNLRAFFRRKKIDADMAEEMRAHLAMQTERNVAAGMAPEEARYAAQRQFGGVEQIKEIAREQRSGQWLEQLGRDFRYGFRQLRRSPIFTGFALLTLVFGIGASTAIFSVVHALLLSPLPYHEADRLVQLQSRHLEQGVSGLAPATFGDLAANNASFAALAAQYYFYVNLTGAETPALLNSADVTADYFRLFGVAALRGRVWSADEIKPGNTRVVVLSHALWSSQFGARDSIVGQPIMLDDLAHTVVGVMPASFKDPAQIAQLWRPMQHGADNLQERSSRYWTAFGRLKPGVPLEQANLELATAARQLEQAHPKNYERWTLQAADLHRLVVGDYRAGLFVVLGAVGCVMLITCANLTGLSLVRATARRKELAIRSALGSSRALLVRQLLTESLILSVAGGAGGVLLGHWGLDLLLASLPRSWLPRADEIALNLPVLAASLALTVFTGVVAGLAPGFTASRVDAGEALKNSLRAPGGPSARRLRSGLVVAEIALAVVLLAGTGLLGRSFVGLMQKKPGFDPKRVLSLTVSLSAKRYDSPQKCREFFSRAQAEVATMPGVEAAGFTQTSPFRWGIPLPFAPLRLDGVVNATDLPPAFTDPVSEDFFKAIGIPLRAGRSFTAADDERKSPVVMISESTARRYFGREDPLGRFLALNNGSRARFEVVGVVGDVRRSGLTSDIPLQVYQPLAQRPPGFAALMVRTGLPPATLVKSVQSAVWRIDPDIPITDVATMDTFVNRSVTQPRLHLTLFVLFAALALLLSCIGLYGLVAYSVDQRTREFGIRTALGANSREVLGLVLREGAVLVALGISLGLAGAFVAARWLRAMVFETSLHDPGVFLAAPFILAAVAAFACWVPARRATKIDPMVALRCE